MEGDGLAGGLLLQLASPATCLLFPLLSSLLSCISGSSISLPLPPFPTPFPTCSLPHHCYLCTCLYPSSCLTAHHPILAFCAFKALLCPHCPAFSPALPFALLAWHLSLCCVAMPLLLSACACLHPHLLFSLPSLCICIFFMYVTTVLCKAVGGVMVMDQVGVHGRGLCCPYLFCFAGSVLQVGDMLT